MTSARLARQTAMLLSEMPEVSWVGYIHPISFKNLGTKQLLWAGSTSPLPSPTGWAAPHPVLDGTGEIVGLFDAGVNWQHCFLSNDWPPDPDNAPPVCHARDFETCSPDLTQKKIVQIFTGGGALLMSS